MSQVRTCPKCAAALPENAPGGICPKCLLRAGFESDVPEVSADQESAYAVTTPQGGGFLPPEAASLAAHFPQLEIIELLGHGGMGAVYKARQKKLDRLIALKIIRPESADDAAFAERFNREARTLARLNHSQIVGVHDFGEVTLDANDPNAGNSITPRKLYYFLMEYVDGANLRQMLDSKELGTEQALAIVPQICDALQFAHDEGIVHRDIKPENILVDRRGRVKIADFGLAKLASRSDQDFTLTATHQVMGTPRYMAPEQMEGSHAVDHRADIYSLGVVFYEMLTRQVPVGHFDPPSKKAGVDARLDEVVLKALARDPERRFQQAQKFKTCVEEISLPDVSSNLLRTGSEIPQRAAGFSTIAEREVQKVFRWVAGDSADKQTETPKLPALLMIALCACGAFLTLLPWMRIEISDPDVVRGMENAQLTTRGDASIYVLTRTGVELPYGVATASCLVALSVFLIVTLGTQTISRNKMLLMTALAGGALLAAFRVPGQLEQESFTFNDKSREPGVASDSAPNIRPIHMLEHQTAPQWSFYATLACASLLLGLSAVGIRHTDQETPEFDTSGRDAPLASFRFTIPAEQEFEPLMKFHFGGLGYRLLKEESGLWVFARGSKVAGLWSFNIKEYFTTLSVRAVENDDQILLNCDWAVKTMGAWIGKKDIRNLKAEGEELQQLLEPKPIVETESPAVETPDQREQSPRPVVRPTGASSSLDFSAASATHKTGGFFRNFFLSPLTPGVMTTLVCIGGLIAFLNPWGTTRVYEGGGYYISHHLYPYHDLWGILVGGTLVALCLIHLMSATSEQRQTWRPFVILISSLCLFVFLWLYAMTQLNTGSNYAQEGFYTEIGFGVALLIVGFWDLRCLLAERRLAVPAASRQLEQVRQIDEHENVLFRPLTPAVLSILACLGGAITVFQPWARISISDPIQPGAEVYVTVNPDGVILGAMFGFLAIILLVTARSRARQGWRPWLILIIGVLLSCVLLQFFRQTASQTNLSLDVAFYWAVGLTGTLLLAGFWDLRCLLSERAKLDEQRLATNASTMHGSSTGSEFSFVKALFVFFCVAIALMLLIVGMYFFFSKHDQATIPPVQQQNDEAGEVTIERESEEGRTDTSDAQDESP